MIFRCRLGIGYGHDFHLPRNAGVQGASEYLDVKASGVYLRTIPQVDPKRIGIYGGSYGGFLTALALASRFTIICCRRRHPRRPQPDRRARPILLDNLYENASITERAPGPLQH